jgi:4-hydroxy-3-methylbut-2-en-1-yl diphosphate reductase
MEPNAAAGHRHVTRTPMTRSAAAGRQAPANPGMRVVRARHLGMCFGVKQAIVRALAAGERQPLTILGDLVHNEAVLADLRARGVRTCAETGDVGTATVMVSAHGASERRLAQLRARDLRVLNATCPLVRAAHRAVAMLVADGCHPVIVGQAGHAEVRGLTEDLESFDVVLRDEDVDGLQQRPRFGIAAQTTQPAERVDRIAALIGRRFPDSEIQTINTVCMPTRLRQQSAEDLARQADVVLVVGGACSNNTRELAATCRRHCARVYHVQTAEDVRPEWLEGVEVAGITAGTSTPGHIIDGVETRVRAIGNGVRTPGAERRAIQRLPCVHPRFTR